jgi:ADP-ribose pyrophosphatase YjhB (NUDIX family)
LTVRATELLGVFERIVPDAEQRTSYHYVLIDFLCEIVSGEMLAGGDASDARWFTPEQVSGLPLPEDTASVIRLGFTKSVA